MKAGAILFAVAAALVAGATNAELERVNLQGSGTYAWLPKIKPPEGWRSNPGIGHQIAATVLEPRRPAEETDHTTIIATAIPKAKDPKVNSLAGLIERERHDHVVVQDHAQYQVREEPSLMSAGGRSFRVFTYSPRKDGIWERAAYAEEGDFYLAFTLGANSRRAVEAARPTFEGMIRQYR